MNDEKEMIQAEVFSKEAILKSGKYANYRDLLGVILKDNMEYTLDKVDKLLRARLKREVN